MNRILLITIILISSLSHSQNEFIEIEVRDSIRLQTLEFEYHVEVTESVEIFDMGSDGMTYDPYIKKENRKRKLSQLKDFLSRNNYDFKALNEESYSINNSPYAYSSGYGVTLKNISEVETLVNQLKELDYVDGRIGDIKYDDNPDYEKRLFEKLILKAKQKAKMIAELSGQKLGKIIEFTEVKEVDDFTFNLMDIYFTSKKSQSWSMFDNQFFGEKFKTIIVKFRTE
ncbi:SIMPL domain-containing protein [uncultured Psychroserpens sp.]|uniref:SIMPL domain-containing protein n=1 Tax=uncultured Psychroserpens sp. TaxID=255436 RepID=UPI002632ECFC|nr:SIMPL domain-containing protein [uncultured Psychroserpens sp.]